MKDMGNVGGLRGMNAPEGAAGPAHAGAAAGDKQRDGRSAGIEKTKKLAELKDELGRARQEFQPFFADDREKAAAVRQLYRRLDPTMELAENNYYHLLIGQQLADLVPASPFWLDYARHEGKGPFLSRNFADGSRNFTEMIFALAVLDLPFEA